MATDFHYVPLAPEALSGPELIDQTERAINELGGCIDEVNTLANQALSAANNALSTANEALLAAQNAQEDADEAGALAATALQTAQTAIADAATAIARANAAFDQAAISDSTAQNALADARTALTTANSAMSQATSAAQDAAQALNIAQGATSTAERALGIFLLDDTERDADEAYYSAEKSYLTNAANVHFPPELTPPIWFEVFITDDETSVTQTAWDNSAGRVFTRCASVNNSDPDNPVVTWTPWNSVAVPETVKNVEVEVDPDEQPAGTYLVITFDTEGGDETVYINMNQLLPVYTSGNGAISVSADDKISLQLDQTGSNLLTVTENGLGFSDTDLSAANIWSNTVNYSPPRLIFGSDGNLYACKQASGPGTDDGAKDPTDAENSAFWGIPTISPNSAPASAGEIASKGYVDEAVSGISTYTATITAESPLTGGGTLDADRAIGLGTVPIAKGGTGQTTAANALAALNGATKPTTAAAIGQFVTLFNTNVLPAGGTWVWWGVSANGDSKIAPGSVANEASGGINAGGTTTGLATNQTVIWAWRIA
ncbi:MAG: hypothetical protein LBP61_03335 [Desulfovibrio sp.]|jgi:multidrug efflux pump subunit AcrA (membrane-fusion protein)|nr:hypothetical protein [Desulfovibrio sp.]